MDVTETLGLSDEVQGDGEFRDLLGVEDSRRRSPMRP